MICETKSDQFPIYRCHEKNQIFKHLRNLFFNTFFALKANKLRFKTFRGIQIRAQIGAKNEKKKTFSTAIIFCREEILTNVYFLLQNKKQTFLLVLQMIGFLKNKKSFSISHSFFVFIALYQ
jgi:hypothetical protein